ncbi:MAG: hypothetical protein SFX73_16165 [Kofleriaceae bacterium]|nr:hypothetical protein [Kofleriaceae bacterium]
MRSLIVFLVLAACVETDAVTCPSGLLCPEGHICDATRDRCIAAGAIEACNGLAPEANCGAGGGLSGKCVDGICTATICGDGVKSPDELCEGDNLGGARCTDLGFYDEPGLACTPFCTFDVAACTGFCGDDLINGGELCDGAPPIESCYDVGFDAGTLGCTNACIASVQACTRFGFRPQPIGYPLYGVDGLSLTDIWAVGDAGRAAHLENAQWVTYQTETTLDLLAIEVTAPDDAWAISTSNVQRWDGVRWTQVTGVPAGTYLSLWAGGPDAVLIGTTTGVLAWDGVMWSTVGTQTQQAAAVAATSLTDVWAGFPDELMHWNGTTWTTAHPATVLAIQALGPNNVWIAGRERSDFTGKALAAHWDGQTWTDHVFRHIPSFEMNSLAASADNEVWATDGNYTLLHFDGREWVSLASVANLSGQVGRIVSLGAGMVAGAAATGSVHRFRGQAYVDLDAALAGARIRALWGDTLNETFLGTSTGRIFQLRDNVWEPTQVASTSITSIWGASPSAVWAASEGDSKVFFYDGTAWSQVLSSSNAQIIVGTSATDVWTFGVSQQHWDGTSWTLSTLNGQRAVAASASAPDNVWLVTQDETGKNIWRWNGSEWLNLPTVPNAVGVVTFSPANTVVASSNAVHRWDGAQWTQTPFLALEPLARIAANGPNDIVVAGTRDVFHFDGTRWSQMRSPELAFASAIDAISMSPARINFALGGNTPARVWSLLRVLPWSCDVSETGCLDGVDNDCDGQVDSNDSDCP